MTIHFLKLSDKFYEDVKNGTKTFEIRKDDRGFAAKDKLILREVASDGGFTGRLCAYEVKYILHNQDFPSGIPEGYVVMSIVPVAEWDEYERTQLPQMAEEKGIDKIWLALAVGEEMFRSKFSEHYHITAYYDGVILQPEFELGLKEICKLGYKFSANTRDIVSVIEIDVSLETDVGRVIAYLRSKGVEKTISASYCTDQKFSAELFQ